MSDQKASRRQFVAGAGVTAIVGIAGCIGQQNSPGQTEQPDTTTEAPDTETSTSEPTTTRTTEREPETPVVEMITDNQGSYFDPIGLRIEPGTTVRFLNESGSHSATAYHPENGDQPLRIPEAATPWDSGVYTTVGETFEHTFETEGVYDYYCTPHEALGMVGRIVVGSPQGGPGTEPPDELPPAAREKLPAVDTIVEQEVVSGQ